MAHKIIGTFISGPSQCKFMETLFTDILTTKKNKPEIQRPRSSIKAKCDRLTNVISKVEKKLHVNFVEKRVIRTVLKKGIAEGVFQHLTSIHEFKFARGCVKMRARQDIQKTTKLRED